jgi:polyhydroxyalkanoate synthesis regulator phasin
VVNVLVKDNKISDIEAKKLKTEIIKYRDNIQSWITKNIDHRINEVLNRMNLANRDQVLELTTKIKSLNNKITKLEKSKSTSGTKKATASKTAKK